MKCYFALLLCAFSLPLSADIRTAYTAADTISGDDVTYMIDVDGVPADRYVTFDQIVSPFAADPSSNAAFDAAAWAEDLEITSDWADITGTPTTLDGYGITDAYTQAAADDAFATAAQGTLADSALQPGDNISELTNDAGYLTEATGYTQAAADAIMVDKQSLGVNRLGRLHDTLSKIASGDQNRLMTVRLGDSLGSKLARPLEREQLKYWYPNPDDVYVAYATGTPRTGYGGTNVSVEGTGEKMIKTDYKINTTGTYYQLDSGEYYHYSDGLTLYPVDRIVIPLITEPDAGSVKIRIADTSSASGDQSSTAWDEISQTDIASSHTLTSGELVVDLDGTFGLDIVVLEFSSARQVVLEIAQVSGGSVRIAPLMFEQNSSPTINYYQLAEGSNDFGNVDADSVPLMAALFDSLMPDIITIQSDDKADSCLAILDLLDDIFSEMTVDRPFVLFVGEGPKSSDSYDIYGVYQQASARCADLGFGCVSGLDLVPNWTELELLGADDDWVVELSSGSIDGIHLGTRFYSELSALAARKYGIDRARGEAEDDSGVKKYLKSSGLSYDLSQFSFDEIGTVGSATIDDDGYMWTLSTGTTANSEITYALDDYAGPITYTKSSVGIDLGRPVQIDWAMAISYAAENTEGKFWFHYGITDRDASDANDPDSYCWTVAMDNLTPKLQGYGSALSEEYCDYTMPASSAAYYWVLYRLVIVGDGTAHLYIDGDHRATLTDGPTTGNTDGSIKIAIKNGDTAANYGVKITPPQVRPLLSY
jgi:hypothetical protein